MIRPSMNIAMHRRVIARGMRAIAVVCVGMLLTATMAHAQNVVPENTADLYPLGPGARGALGQPHAFGKLLVQFDVLPACTFVTGGLAQVATVHCTRGVPYRLRILDDADPAFDLTRAFAPRPPARGTLLRIEAQRLDVEF
jgi:hypothetical protein